jgi:mRNA deadenylase 3'-5' endonuclease subunit Ccr4
MESHQIRVLQYNVLADCYTTGVNAQHLNQTNLGWQERWPKLRREIEQSPADLIFLCEVDHLHDCWAPLLSAQGFAYVTASRLDRDFVLIAYRKSKFQLLKSYEVQHSDTLVPLFPPL